MELPPHICFSESELEQAGLLDDTDSCNVAPSPEFDFEGSEQQQQCWYTLQSLSTKSCGLANRLQTLTECWQVPGLGGASTSSLHTSRGTQRTTVYDDVTVQAPPLPEESPQRRTHFQQQTLAPGEHTVNIAEQDRSMPADSTAVPIKKQANRDYQKKFRARQKVCFNAFISSLSLSLRPQQDVSACCLKFDSLLWQCICLSTISGQVALVLQARSEAMQAQLDATLTQLQDLKLQKLELEQKLQQRVRISSLPRVTGSCPC